MRRTRIRTGLAVAGLLAGAATSGVIPSSSAAAAGGAGVHTASVPAPTGWVNIGEHVASDVAVITSTRTFNGGLVPFNSAVFVRASGEVIRHQFDGLTPHGTSASLGGVARSSPAIAAQPVGGGEEVEHVFVRGADRAVHVSTSFQWQSLGGVTKFTPIAATDLDGRVHVFAVGADDALYHNVRSGSSWSGWQGLGGRLVTDPAAVPSASGIEVTGVGLDGALWTGRITGAGSWSGWSSLGGVVNSYPWMATNPEGTWAFAVGIDGALWANRTSGGAWSGWSSLGGSVTSGPGSAVRGDGELTALVVGVDGAAYAQVVTIAGGQGWRSLGGQFVSNLFGAGIGDTIRVFGVGVGGHLWFNTL